MSMLEKFKQGLAKSRDSFVHGVGGIFKGKEISEEFYEELEESLIMSDVGAETSMNIIEELRREVQQNKINNTMEVKKVLMQKIADRLRNEEITSEDSIVPPRVILIVGVNGSGKTTTIGKLARKWINDQKKVMIVAGDTFRAAAIEQLEIWGSRVGAEVIKQQAGSDPSSVYFDALQAAASRNIDVVIGDTAGRLHTKVNLMEELKKIHRVTGKVKDDAPHETLLVIDATTGQNGLAQAQKFSEAIPVSGIVLTKLDGTAKGGIVLAIKEQLGLPIKYVGLGEGIDDLEPFDPEIFVQALLGDEDEN